MKRVFYSFMSLILLSGLTIFSSCSKDDTTTPTDLNPVLNFKGGAGYTSTDVTLAEGAEFKVGIIASSNVSSGAVLVRFKVTRTFNNKPDVVIDTTINTASFNADITASARTVVGEERWTYTVTDKDNQVNELAINITTQKVYGPITEFTMKVLGAQHNATGSSFASADGIVYKLADAKANAAMIDWMYFNDDPKFATLCSPNDPDAALIFSDPTNGVATWSVRNATVFKKVTDPITWSAITNDSTLIAQTASGVSLSEITNLAKDDILSFITASGKKGMIRVDDITGTDAGQITISVKVQQTKK
jgi:hypothetical protein